MKRIYIIVIIFILTKPYFFSQGLSPVWLSSAGSRSWDNISGIVSVNNSIIYYAEAGESPFIINSEDTLHVNSLYVTAFLGSFDLEGKMQWTSQISGNQIKPMGIKRTSDTTLILFTCFTDSILLEDKWIKCQGTNLLVSEFNITNKTTTSLCKIPWSYYSHLKDIAFTDNKIWMLTEYQDSLPMGDLLVPVKGLQNVALIALDFTGNVEWHKCWGEYGINSSSNISLDSEGNIYVGLNLINSKTGETDSRIVKFDNQGNQEYNKLIFSSSRSCIKTIFLKDSSLIIGSNIQDTLIVDSCIIGSSGMRDILISSITTKGEKMWHSHLGGYGDDWVNVITGYDNYILAGGVTYGQLNVFSDTIYQTYPAGSIFFIRLIDDGTIIEAREIKGIGEDFPRHFIVGADNHFYMSGLFRKTLKAKKQLVFTQGEEDVFISKIINCDAIKYNGIQGDTLLCPDASLILDAGAGFKEYYWYDNAAGIQTIEIWNEGTYKVLVVDSLGCFFEDSIVVKPATVPNPDLGSDISMSPNDSLWLWPGAFQSYVWDNGSISDSIKIIGHFITNDSTIVTVEVSNGICVSSDTVTVYNSFNNSNPLLDALVAFPTVTHGIVNLKNNSELRGKLFIIGYASDEKSLIFERHTDILAGQTIVFDLSPFPPGTYHIKAFEGEMSKSFTIIKM